MWAAPDVGNEIKNCADNVGDCYTKGVEKPANDAIKHISDLGENAVNSNCVTGAAGGIIGGAWKEASGVPANPGRFTPCDFKSRCQFVLQLLAHSSSL